MNPIERAIRRVNAAQQRRKAPAFVFGIIKKYGDDNGGVLAASLAHSGFVCLFPLLLVLVTILGLVASGDPSLRHEALGAVAKQVPLIGHQLAGNVHQLRRSSVIGLVGRPARPDLGNDRPRAGQPAHDGAGVEPAGARTARLPAAPRPSRAVLGRARARSDRHDAADQLERLRSQRHRDRGPAGGPRRRSQHRHVPDRLPRPRPKGVPARKLVPGAVAGGPAWTVLQAVGTYVVHHFLHSDSVYGVFATVLGLLAWIYLGVEITV